MPCVKHAGAPLENATFDEENMESISEFAEQIISCGAHRIVLSGPRGEKRYKKSTFSLVNGQYFIERLTEKQAAAAPALQLRRRLNRKTERKNTSLQRALSYPRWQTWALWQVTVRYTRPCTTSSNR